MPSRIRRQSGARQGSARLDETLSLLAGAPVPSSQSERDTAASANGRCIRLFRTIGIEVTPGARCGGLDAARKDCFRTLTGAAVSPAPASGCHWLLGSVALGRLVSLHMTEGAHRHAARPCKHPHAAVVPTPLPRGLRRSARCAWSRSRSSRRSCRPPAASRRTRDAAGTRACRTPAPPGP